ncbi:8423_t:CDS:2 [Funneliformis geosporum]|nr:8423_t:CDS:2 [Funneliformis geosporum]
MSHDAPSSINPFLFKNIRFGILQQPPLQFDQPVGKQFFDKFALQVLSVEGDVKNNLYTNRVSSNAQ